MIICPILFRPLPGHGAAAFRDQGLIVCLVAVPPIIGHHEDGLREEVQPGIEVVINLQAQVRGHHA